MACLTREKGRYYVHTSDYELPGATATLRGKRDGGGASDARDAGAFKFIPFRQRHVG